MKKLLLILLLFVLCLSAEDKAGKIFPYKYEKITLKNGFTAFLIPMTNSELVSYYSVVRTGSRDEWEPGKSGFAHFFEHMMFRGTTRFPGNVYDSIITSIGADANAYTSDDLTVYHLNFASQNLELVMDLESDRFRNLKYTKEQFQTESGAVYGEYRKSRTSPWSVAYEELRNLAFDAHTYKHTTIGFERDIKEMPNQYDYSISFYDRYYRPSNVVLVIAGNFNVSSVKKQLEKYYGPWKPGYVPPKIPVEPKQISKRSKEVQYEGKTLPLLVYGFKCDAFSVTNEQYLAAQLIPELFFGETSELYKKLVLTEQKVQMLGAGAPVNRDPNLFEIYAMVKNPADLEYVKTEINKTLGSIKSVQVESKRLNDLKKRNKYSFLMALDNPESVASMLPQFLTMTGEVSSVDAFYSGLEKVTAADIIKAASGYFRDEQLTIITLQGGN